MSSHALSNDEHGVRIIRPTILRWGITLGVSLCLWTLALHALGFYTSNIAAGKLADVVVTILPLLMIALALRQRAAMVTITIRDALGISIGVSGVSALFSVPFLWVYHHYVNPAWLTILMSYERGRLTASGVSATEVARTLAALERSGTDASQLTAGIIGSLMLGVVVGLLAYALIRFFRAARGLILTRRRDRQRMTS